MENSSVWANYGYNEKKPEVLYSAAKDKFMMQSSQLVLKKHFHEIMNER